ncbi:hypothetical protein DYB32_008488 [Aphanomyces invadans]|uniref:Tryptophan synthase beta chain-like PALP domain-containing protein n=1 Tax=Aphanomyces invadans TaxID=157072 RepID=A0A3R6WGS5_9STRA|nr:hypothetical protein DYB32_008488 [Aphanomyces invadans]
MDATLMTMDVAKGYKCLIVMPDDQAKEKGELLQKFGATVEFVKPASIVNAKHYVNQARRRASEIAGAPLPPKAHLTRGPGGYFADQFENLANTEIHYRTTGTGGTIAGVSRYLKEQNPAIQIVLADPPGSSLYNKVRHNVCYAPQQSERTVKRHRYDTVAEGIGIDRLTANFLLANIDDAYVVSDEEAVNMSRHLLAEDGIFVGSSSAMNCVAAVRLAKKLGPGHVIVTILCDSGQRHLTKFWNNDYLKSQWDLEATATDLSFLDHSTGQP